LDKLRGVRTRATKAWGFSKKGRSPKGKVKLKAREPKRDPCDRRIMRDTYFKPIRAEFVKIGKKRQQKEGRKTASNRLFDALGGGGVKIGP